MPYSCSMVSWEILPGGIMTCFMLLSDINLLPWIVTCSHTDFRYREVQVVTKNYDIIPYKYTVAVRTRKL